MNQQVYYHMADNISGCVIVMLELTNDLIMESM